MQHKLHYVILCCSNTWIAYIVIIHLLVLAIELPGVGEGNTHSKSPACLLDARALFQQTDRLQNVPDTLGKS